MKKLISILIVVALITCEKREFVEIAQVITGEPIDIKAKTAILEGTIIDVGIGISNHGHCWSFQNNVPTIEDDKSELGSATEGKSYQSNSEELEAAKKYYYRAYIISKGEVIYGDVNDYSTSDGIATVITGDVSEITYESAKLTGGVTDDGDDTVVQKGFCWSNNDSFNLTNNIGSTNNGNGLGEFEDTITGLIPDSVYYYTVYALTTVDTTYGEIKTFTAENGNPIVSTTELTMVTSESAVGGGSISDEGAAPVTARGVCWSTSTNPTVSDSTTSDGTGIGTYISLISGLAPGITYYVRAYATNSFGVAYGMEQMLGTDPVEPTIRTSNITNVMTTSADSGGEIINDGGRTIVSKGVCWSTFPNPKVSDNRLFSDPSITGGFVISISSLVPGITYYLKAYAENSVGIAYGDEHSFTTRDGVVNLTTQNIINITVSTAESGGEINDNGGALITSRGVCWSTTANPTVSDNTSSDGTGIGIYVSSISGLTPGITYHVRAYATNSVGVSYGNEQIFTTITEIPTITTNGITNIKANTAESGGNISDNGGATITSRGVCWSAVSNPTVSDNTTSDGTGIGSFVSTITGLSPGTDYYVRAYAINTAGVAYGEEMVFKTNTWVQKADFGGTARMWATGFSIEDKGYIGVGHDGSSYKTDFWEYDPSTNVWSQKADFSSSPRSHVISFGIGSKGYLGAGQDGEFFYSSFWEYDPASNTWSQKAFVGGGARMSAVSFSIGDKGYSGMGFGVNVDENPYRTDFWEYDPTTNIWSQKMAYGGSYVADAFGFSIGNKGYVGTGQYESIYTKDFWEYDPVANTWTQKADFGGTAREKAVGFSIGSLGYVGTGYDGSYKQDFWEYDPIANTWTQKADFGGTARRRAVGFSIGSKGYIGTGRNSSFNKDFWEYDPANDQ